MNDIENVELKDVDTAELATVEGGMFGLDDCPGWVIVAGALVGPVVPAYCLIAWL
jgi:hypothetical protein